MKIYLLDKNKNMTEVWKRYFKNEDDVEIACMDFFTFMYSHDIECVVSPANSFGLMDGGYDLAITNYFGDELMKKVQEYIINYYKGEQPTGTAFIIDIPNTGKKLIHTPTMRTPREIKDILVIYYAMKETLRIAKENNIQSIVIPAFGGGCGKVDYEKIAEMMKYAFVQSNNPPKEIDWEYAWELDI